VLVGSLNDAKKHASLDNHDNCQFVMRAWRRLLLNNLPGNSQNLFRPLDRANVGDKLGNTNRKPNDRLSVAGGL
jgi:hypothetical protein